MVVDNWHHKRHACNVFVYVGVGVDTVDYSLYPSKETQLVWLRAYLEEKNLLESGHQCDVTEASVNTLYVQANKCALVSSN